MNQNNEPMWLKIMRACDPSITDEQAEDMRIDAARSFKPSSFNSMDDNERYATGQKDYGHLSGDELLNAIRSN